MKQMSKGYVKIENEGLIDPNAFMLLGATSKRGDSSKIGYFGSGLKYSMAVLLSNGIDFKIFSGNEEIKIKTVKKDFRGQEIEVIKVNGKETSLTTAMGPDWEPWFAIREIYCNAIDEGSHKLGIAGQPEPIEGKTVFYVEFSPKLDDLFNNWDEYFSDKRQDLLTEDKSIGTKIFSGHSQKLVVYRKGVRCYDDRVASLFHYDVAWAKINESRVLDNSWSFKMEVPKVLAKVATPGMVRTIFSSPRDNFEAGLDWNYASMFNSNWLEAIAGRKLVAEEISGYFMEEISRGNVLVLPKKLVRALADYYGTAIEVLGSSDRFDYNGAPVEWSELQLKYMTDIKQFFTSGGIDIEKYTVVLYAFTDENKLAQGVNKELRISPKLFDLGKRAMATTMLQEYARLESGAADKTNAFEDYLFGKMVRLIEEKSGILL